MTFLRDPQMRDREWLARPEPAHLDLTKKWSTICFARRIVLLTLGAVWFIGMFAAPASAARNVDPALSSPRGRAWEQMAGDGAASTGGTRNPHLQSIGLSILLPGLAQYRMGHKLRATGYFAAEAACWTAFATYRIQGANREDSYREMAELFAGVQDPDSRSDDYFKNIAGWPSSELYNEIVVRRDARAEHGDDLEARAAYYESNKIQGVEEWSWDSEAARSRYRDKRNDAQRSFKNSRNMIGLAVANRVVAMIDAVLLERRHSNMRVELVPDPMNRGARISISRAVP